LLTFLGRRFDIMTTKGKRVGVNKGKKGGRSLLNGQKQNKEEASREKRKKKNLN